MSGKMDQKDFSAVGSLFSDRLLGQYLNQYPDRQMLERKAKHFSANVIRSSDEQCGMKVTRNNLKLLSD